ncbi:MAG: cytochrome P450 [Actinomycetota bacterium]
MKTASIDFYDPGRFVDSVPLEDFRWLRENEPVYFNPQENGPGFWNLTKYDDVVSASRNWETFSSARGTNIDDPAGGVELMMVNMDPPKHTKLRMLVRTGFTPRRVGNIEPHVREIATKIIDGVAGKGECDFVTDIAAELPLQVITEMIGVPDEDRHKIFHWSNQMIGLDDPEYGNSIDVATAAAFEMYEYWDGLGKERRGERREDLVTALVEAEIDSQGLSDLEIDVFLLLLAVAGNETTRNLISHGMHSLAQNPEEKERLLAQPDLLPLTVEEMLRTATPVMHFRRTATKDTEVRGVPIKEGQKVLLWYISGNRDEEVFPQPDRFDVGRTPNEHLGFGGGGPHFCLGANLARLEIRVMFEELLRRLPDIELAGPVPRLRSNFINGLKHMPVRFTPERA